MLRFDGNYESYCDGVNRPNFLQAGFLGLGTLTLPQLLAHRTKHNQNEGPKLKDTY